MCATLDVMREEDVPARAEERGAQVREALVALHDRYDWIGDVRGMGLMQALEIVKDKASAEPDMVRAKALLEATKAERLLIGLGGMHGHVIRLGPSLLITEAETAEALARLQSLVAAAAHLPKYRKPTKPTRSSQVRRVENKKRHSRLKALRAKVFD